LLEGARKFSFPAGLLDDAQDAVLLCIPVPVVPYFRRFFAQMESPYVWKTPEDFQRAYPVFAEIEAQMTASCVSTITTSIDRLYRLLDTSLNGTQYSAQVVNGETVVEPALPAVPPASTNATNALRAHVSRLWQLGENAVAGVTAGPGESIADAPALPDFTTERELLRRLISGVDGNGDPAPADNLLMALRGTAAATTDRNLTSLIDQVETLLGEIREKLV
jgi:hypothetical protein